MAKAADKRYDGINRVSTAVVETVVQEIDGEREPVQIWHTRDRSKIAAEIRTLAPLGRTDRWKGAVEGWALAVETEPNFEWAFFQYGIFAGHAAE